MDITTFREFDISETTLRGLDKMGFKTPTPVQRETIIPMMGNKDVIVQAPTGTGKTCAFGIPVVEALDAENSSIQAVVVCPTRELAIQTTAVLKQLTAYKHGIRIMTIYGGERIENQISALRRRPQIIVATPGRLIDHINRHTCKLGNVKLVILDEADRMLDMGFIHDMDTILKSIPERHQTVLFSATMSKEVKKIAEKYQTDAEIIKIGTDRPIDTVKQYYAEARDKTAALFGLIREKKFGLTLVFVATKRRADKVARQLNQDGFRAEAIHGDLNQRQREHVMARYRSGHINILVATDVAARGIDVNNIDAVINYDIPLETDNYTHRIGRTGRASKHGAAYTFIAIDDRAMLHEIISATGAKIQRLVYDGDAEVMFTEAPPVALIARGYNGRNNTAPYLSKKPQQQRNRRRPPSYGAVHKKAGISRQDN